MFQVFTIQVLFIKSIQLLQNITLYTKIFFKCLLSKYYIKLAQKVRTILFAIFFGVTMLGNKSYTNENPVHFPFEWCHNCKEHAFMR